jgi:predicted nucleic acid-binding protein
VLDSSVVIDLLRRRPGATGRLRALGEAGDDVYTCAIVADEVTFGLRPREREAASLLFEGFAVAPLGIAEGRLSGWWRQRYRKRGRTLHPSDCLIAAAAMGIGARLATGNPKDFPMKELTVEHWPSGE